MSEVSEYVRAEKIALRLIARAEQCSAGLTRKLEKRKFNASCISEVISRLCELNLLDDSRFARLWLQSRLRLTRSPRRLLSSLCARGIHQNDAQIALKAVLDEEAELDLLTRFAKKHLKKTGNKTEMKYLLKNEGFSSQVIHRFLGID
jgi:regulatory protein